MSCAEEEIRVVDTFSRRRSTIALGSAGQSLAALSSDGAVAWTQGPMSLFAALFGGVQRQIPAESPIAAGSVAFQAQLLIWRETTGSSHSTALQ